MAARSKKDVLADQIALAVGAGKEVAVETVDFSDPNRPKTCLEVDFPILPVNQVAIIEGNAGKPIYQMSKWWARRRSSVFRSMLLAAAMKAPEDSSEAAKSVWDVYYANHQKRKALSHIKVADIFMGGGTTLVEGSRLGMQMYGNDLNPVAWLVVKNELAKVDRAEIESLLQAIEDEVKPQIMPFYACDCPRGHKGQWKHIPTGKIMGADFDPLKLNRAERKDYRYSGPEVIYTFWAKHGPCQVTGCGHRTPIMSSPVIAIKELSIKHLPDTQCQKCLQSFDLDLEDPRMAPSASIYISPDEKPFALLNSKDQFTCPHCQTLHQHNDTKSKSKNKKVLLSLLVHPDWLKGEAGSAPDGSHYGGSADSTPVSTAAWNLARASKLSFLEVRGPLPEEVTCPETNKIFSTKNGTVPKRSNFVCQAPTCGKQQDSLKAIKASRNTAPVSIYAIQGYCPQCSQEKAPYNGRFFDVAKVEPYNLAEYEWNQLKNSEYLAYWPKSEVPYGFMTSMNNGGIPNHGYTHWWKMFNPRQLLIIVQLMKIISENGNYNQLTREFVLGAFQQYLRNQNMFCFWDRDYDKLVPLMSNNNYHPKTNLIENSVFSDYGRGNWESCFRNAMNGLDWSNNPWELVSTQKLAKNNPELISALKGKSEKVLIKDPIIPAPISCGSSSDLHHLTNESFDLVITDPPFGGLLHYSELADFFYVWLRLALKDKYPELFTAEYTPKTLEAVANRARQPEDPDGFYQRILTECWKEAHRILKPGGILAFTFHHSEDEPWVNVLESLFSAGFYLEATYPIRSDETKGEGSKPGTFGSQKIEYDIIHVCRKRTEDSSPVSWARMRRQVMRDIQQIQGMLNQHQGSGIQTADLQVIKRGKALEYFSRHYGKVFVEEDVPMTVQEALVGINLLISEYQEASPPPSEAEPMTQQFLRIFGQTDTIARDGLHKFLRGTGMAAGDFVERGWCSEKNKIFYATSPLEMANAWVGKPRAKMRDYDQLMFLIGAAFDGSGINVNETLNNPNFKPHLALKPLLKWMFNHAANSDIRTAAQRAYQLYENWEKRNPRIAVEQMSFLGDLEG